MDSMPHSAENATDSDLSNGLFVTSFLVLLLILLVFGDLMVFILGLIGLTAIYAGYFTSRAEREEHH